MTDFISRFSNELIGRKNAVNGETPRLQSQRTRNDTKRTVAVRKFGRIVVIRSAIAAATSKPTGKRRLMYLKSILIKTIFHLSHHLSRRTSNAKFSWYVKCSLKLASPDLKWVKRFHFCLLIRRFSRKISQTSFFTSTSTTHRNWRARIVAVARRSKKMCSCNIFAWARAQDEKKKLWN